MAKSERDPLRVAVGRRIRRYREVVLNLTLRDFAALLDIPENRLTQWEHGYNFPKPHDMIRMKERAALSPDFLITGDISKTDPEHRAQLSKSHK